MWGVALSMDGNSSMRTRGFTMKLLDVFTTETFIAEEPLARAAVNSPHIFCQSGIAPCQYPSEPTINTAEGGKGGKSTHNGVEHHIE